MDPSFFPSPRTTSKLKPSEAREWMELTRPRLTCTPLSHWVKSMQNSKGNLAHFNSKFIKLGPPNQVINGSNASRRAAIFGQENVGLQQPSKNGGGAVYKNGKPGRKIPGVKKPIVSGNCPLKEHNHNSNLTVCFLESRC